MLILLAIAPGAVGLGYIFLLPLAAEELGHRPGRARRTARRQRARRAARGASLEAVHRRVGHGRGVVAGIGGAAISMSAFGVVPGVPLALLALAVIGGSILTYAASSVTFIQALAPPRLRGRLVSLFAMLYWGMMPVGSLVTGFVAEATTARTTCSLCGVGLGLTGPVAFIIRPQIGDVVGGSRRADVDGGPGRLRRGHGGTGQRWLIRGLRAPAISGHDPGSRS